MTARPKLPRRLPQLAPTRIVLPRLMRRIPTRCVLCGAPAGDVCDDCWYRGGGAAPYWPEGT